MRIALWIYIAAFAAISVFALLHPELRGAPGEMVLDIVLSTVALIGLIAYAIRLDAPRLIAAWKFVAPALLIGFIVQLIVEWPQLAASDPELSSTENQVLLAITLIVSTIFLAPAVIVNFRFTRSRHLPMTHPSSGLRPPSPL